MVTDDMAEQIQRGTSEPSSKLFVRNLWYGTTEEDLKEKFDGCARVNIPVDPKSGSNKGYVLNLKPHALLSTPFLIL